MGLSVHSSVSDPCVISSALYRGSRVDGNGDNYDG